MTQLNIIEMKVNGQIQRVLSLLLCKTLYRQQKEWQLKVIIYPYRKYVFHIGDVCATCRIQNLYKQFFYFKIRETYI